MPIVKHPLVNCQYAKNLGIFLNSVQNRRSTACSEGHLFSDIDFVTHELSRSKKSMTCILAFLKPMTMESTKNMNRSRWSSTIKPLDTPCLPECHKGFFTLSNILQRSFLSRYQQFSVGRRLVKPGIFLSKRAGKWWAFPSYFDGHSKEAISGCLRFRWWRRSSAKSSKKCCLACKRFCQNQG